MKTLNDILINYHQSNDFEITGLSHDSRFIQKGNVFFALSGTQNQGHDYIQEACERGATAIVTKATCKANCPVIVVSNPAHEYAIACHEWFEKPSEKLFMIGVTGTSGKTSLTYLLEKIFSSCLLTDVGVIGTNNIRYQGKIHETNHTTPDPYTLQKTLQEMVQSQVGCVAMEVSSHALSQYRVDGTAYDVAVFHNLSQDHMDYHQDFEEYFQAKARLFYEVLAQSSKTKKLAVINHDDAYGQRLLESLQKSQSYSCVSYSLDATAHASVKLLSCVALPLGSKCEIQYYDKKITIHTNLIGLHNISNILATLAVFGYYHPEAAVRDAFENVYIPGRLDRVPHTNIFVDYAHKPDALEKVLQEVRKIMTHGRLIVVFGCGGDRDRTKRPLMGKIASKLADIVVITSDNPRTETPHDIINEICEGVRPFIPAYNGEKGYIIEPDRLKALHEVLTLAKNEDVVVVAGKGHEDYQIIGTQKYPFDDKKIIEKYLKEKC